MDIPAHISAAEMVHNTMRNYAEKIGETWPLWEHLSPDIRYVTSRLVEFVTARGDILPEDLHHRWFVLMSEMGWTYGSLYSESEKKHPNLRSWERMSAAQRHKDTIFITVCKMVNNINGFNPVHESATTTVINIYQNGHNSTMGQDQ